MSIIGKNVIFHSYTILSCKRVISFHSCFKFFKTCSSLPIYFLGKILFFTVTISTGAFRLYYICFVEVVQAMIVCVFKVFYSAFTTQKSYHIYIYIYILLQHGRFFFHRCFVVQIRHDGEEYKRAGGF